MAYCEAKYFAERFISAHDAGEHSHKQQKRHPSNLYVDWQLREHFSLQAHHLCNRIANHQPNHTRIDYHDEALINIDPDNSSFLVAKNHEDGYLVRLVDDVDVSCRHK